MESLTRRDEAVEASTDGVDRPTTVPRVQSAHPGGGRALRADERTRQRSLRELVTPLIKGQRRRIALLAISAVVGGLAEAAVLVIVARTAFAFVGGHDKVRIDVGPVDTRISVTMLLAVAAGLVVLRTLLNVAQAHLSAATSTRVVARTRKETIAGFLAASWALQSNERGGRLQELLTTFASNAGAVVINITSGVVSLLNFAAFLVTAIVVNVVAAVAVGAAVIVLGVLLRPFRMQVRRRSKLSAGANVVFATTLTEFTTAMQEIRVFGVKGKVRDRLGALTDDARVTQYRTRSLNLLVPGLYQGAALLLIVAALAIVHASDARDLASLGAVVLLMIRSLTYGQSIQTSLQALHENAPFLETLEEEHARYREAAQVTGGAEIGKIGDLRFEEVRFEYFPGRPVLHDLTFRVDAGEIVGVVGPSGSGKSTLMQLILRLRAPTGGRILANEREVSGLDVEDWYRHVAFVPQEAHLFAGTIAENIRFFRDDVTSADVERAARRAHIHEDIVGLPDGYDSFAGERGGALSGGQRQRLCIARALVREPDLLVLDEPTSALDARSEALMRETIDELSPRATVFVIAHRLSTLAVCHRIMVIANGRLEHFAEPTQLRADNHFFRDVVRLSGIN